MNLRLLKESLEGIANGQIRYFAIGFDFSSSLDLPFPMSLGSWNTLHIFREQCGAEQGPLDYLSMYRVFKIVRNSVSGDQ